MGGQLHIDAHIQNICRSSRVNADDRRQPALRKRKHGKSPDGAATRNIHLERSAPEHSATPGGDPLTLWSQMLTCIPNWLAALCR